MFRVGEKVRYLDEVGEATIVHIVDAKTAIVEDEYGLKHPYPLSKLVPAERDHVPAQPQPQYIQPETPKPQPKPAPKPSNTVALPELALVFTSTNSSKPESGDLDLLFVNSSNYHLLVNVAAKEGDEWFSIFNGEILPKSDQLVQSLRRQDIGMLSNLNVDVIFFGKTGYEAREPISCLTKVKVTRFVKPGNYLTYEGIENPGICFPIEKEKAVTAPSFPKIPQSGKQVQKPSLPTIEEEVDLHLEAILGTEPNDMPDHEKFLTQMRHFERKLNNALTRKYVQITFIHGVGSGKLKEAIRQELTEYGLTFEEGPFHRYGVGATVVRLH
ncbi:MAG: DUF2027 domain-containing protein [Flavobacteriales bacterium]|nr:DUF2027 domain-containing protein [Flavobacteriales bacterium]